MKTLIIGEIHENAKRLLYEKTEVKEISNKDFSKSDVFQGFEIIMIRTHTKFGKQELDKLPNLKYLVSCSVGFDNIDLEALKERGIKLIHSEGTNANSVVEHTIYLIMALIRQEDKKPFFELKNKTIGLIGFGNIGKLMARKLLGFDIRVIAYDIIGQDQRVLEELKVEMKNLQDVIRESDIISVHVPLNKDTKGMINNEIFKEMKEGTFFVNTSRAEVIDENALIKYFRSGKLRGIGLDVYSNELKNNLNFGNAGNVILTNHTAALGEDSFEEMCINPVRKLLERL